MLLSVGRQRYISESATDSVHNYYEQMVFEQLSRAFKRASEDSEFLADAACVALNRLPPRYVRHDVDMTFFMTPNELDEMVNNVVRAVNEAVEYVESREREKAEKEQQENQDQQVEEDQPE
ncbi:late competence development ComFB family protein [Agarilytica rhodophyticola]|uniref:late competence development ComFB family protein n=1 Tax=Agarilytica rhodophyticola TaxID=1737490 RepID=UPI000B34379D|nr:late competence development ComFB family protein [Agarilytica rhodophyticola]